MNIELTLINDILNLPLPLSFSLNYKTSITTDRAGRETRIPQWEDGIIKWKINRNAIPQYQLAALLELFDRSQGGKSGFLIKDPFDHQVSAPEGKLIKDVIEDYYWLVTTYYCGDSRSYRTIHYVEENSLQIYADGVEIDSQDYYFYESGKIAFVNPPSLNSELTADFIFYVPVSFEVPQLQDKIESTSTFSLDEFVLTEIKQSCLPQPDIYKGYPQFDAYTYYHETQVSHNYKLKNPEIPSGYRATDLERTTKLHTVTLGKQEDLDYQAVYDLVSFFRCCKGSAYHFEAITPIVNDISNFRFESDTLNIDIFNLEILRCSVTPPALSEVYLDELPQPTIDTVSKSDLTISVNYQHNYGGQQPNKRYGTIFQNFICNSNYPGGGYWTPTEPWLYGFGGRVYYGPISISISRSGTYCTGVANRPNITAYISDRDGTRDFTDNSSAGLRFWGFQPRDGVADTYTDSVYLKDATTNTITARIYGLPEQIRIHNSQIEVFCYGVIESTINSDQYQPWQFNPIFDAEKKWHKISKFNPGSVINEYTITSQNNQCESEFCADLLLLDAFPTGVLPYCRLITIGTHHLTDRDRDVVYNNIRYKTGIISPTAAASQKTLDNTPDNQSLTGILSSEAINQLDLASGKYYGTEVRIDIFDYLRNQIITGVIFGKIGEITSNNFGYSLKVNSLADALNKPTSWKCSPLCRWDFGSTGCGYDLNSVTYPNLAVTSVLSPTEITCNLSAGNYCSFGLLTWLTGSNVGARSPIQDHQDNLLRLRYPPPFPISVGDTLTAVAGCDKTPFTCRDRYNNYLNFQGEPSNDKGLMPGIDFLVYPRYE